MSIRRKSCDPCFGSRRKCDLEYPVCKRCRKSGSKCHYVYPPQLSTGEDVVKDASNAINAPLSGIVSPGQASYPAQLKRKRSAYSGHLQLDGMVLQSAVLRSPRPEKLLGPLGEPSPVLGTLPWAWVFDQIREYPMAFAKQAETVFIHKQLYANSTPRPLRAAFGICAAATTVNERNRPMLFQVLDSEISDLLTPAFTDTLLDELATLQAAVLYQIIRLFHGGLEQRIVAERQEYLVRSFALTILRRLDAELQDTRQVWETWLLAESIRRTVMIVFKVYTIYASFKYGVCKEATALSFLPMSTKAAAWNSRAAYLQYQDPDEILTHGDFTSLWAAVPVKELDPFEKLVLMGHKKGVRPLEYLAHEEAN